MGGRGIRWVSPGVLMRCLSVVVLPGGGLAEGQGGGSQKCPPGDAGVRGRRTPAPVPASPGATAGQWKGGGSYRSRVIELSSYQNIQVDRTKKPNRWVTVTGDPQRFLFPSRDARTGAKTKDNVAVRVCMAGSQTVGCNAGTPLAHNSSLGFSF